MAADGSIIIETNIDNKKAQQELNRLNKQIRSLEAQLADKKQGRLPLEQSLNAVNEKLKEARRQLSILQDEQSAINAAMQPGASPEDYIRAYADSEKVNAALKEQQAEVDAIEKEWRQAKKAVDTYDTKISGLEGKLNRAKEEAGEIHQYMAQSGPAADEMAKSTDRAQKSASKFSMRLREVIRSALVFTIISQALARFREWLGKIIQSNEAARAAIARLKGALLTLAQPLIDVIIPAFTQFVNLLARIISMAARFVSAIFGTTASQAADSAENLYEETNALEETGEAAKKASKSLASFDEINKLSSDADQTTNAPEEDSTIRPDFSLAKNNMQDALSAISELFTGVALLAIGAILVFTGASIPLGLALMVAGALAITDAITSNPDAIQSMLQDGLGEALTVIGPLVAVIGVILVIMGNITLGISLIILGASIWSVGKASEDEGDFIQNILTRLSEAAEVIGPLVAVLGVLLVVTGHIVQGIAFIIFGAAIWAAGKAYGDEGDFVQNILARLQEAAAAIGPLIAIIGVILLVAGQIAPGIGLIIAGIAIWTFSEVNLDSGNGLASEIVSALSNIFTKIGPFIAIIGLILIFTPLPGFRAIGIGMLVAGIAMFAIGEIGLNYEALSQDIVSGLLNILSAVGPFIAILGLILLFIPGMQAIGAGMIIAGIAIFAISEVALNWDFILEQLKSVWEGIKNWFNTYVAKFFTLEYWANLGKNIINGFLNGLKSAWETVVSWATSVVDWFKGLFGGAKDTASSVQNSATPSSTYRAANAPRLALNDIPALARGAVIPPNREFLAVLGDNKRETEVVSPVSSMKQAFMEAISESGMGQQGTINIQFTGSLSQLARVLKPQIEIEQNRSGVKLVKGGIYG